jgi:hypothetical protein
MVHRPIADKTRLIRNVRPCISISFFTGERKVQPRRAADNRKHARRNPGVGCHDSLSIMRLVIAVYQNFVTLGAFVALNRCSPAQAITDDLSSDSPDSCK